MCALLRDGAGEYRDYFAPVNPFAASYVLPRPLLRAAVSRPLVERRIMDLIKEYYGGLWLFESPYFPIASLRIRKLIPCDPARLKPLLAMHISYSKYTLGAGAQFAVVRSLEQYVNEACSERTPIARFARGNHTLVPPRAAYRPREGGELAALHALRTIKLNRGTDRARRTGATV